MKRLIPLLPRLVCAGTIALGGAAAAQGTAEGDPVPPLPPGASPPQLPELSLPDVTDLRLAVPRPIRAATAALGMGRSRLALVVGIPTVDGKPVADAASRDAAAVAAALRAGGFVVMARDGLDARGLRDNLREFRERLQPGAIGFIYIAALGAQVDGQNLLLARDAVLPASADAAAPAALAAALRRHGVPLSEVIDAVMGTPDSPRLLVVDAAHAHPVLARLPQQGLAEPRLPPGTMALLSSVPGAVQEVAAVAPLPSPEPVDPREIAATPFGRTLTHALLNPRASGPEVLRSTRHALFDGSAGRINAWVGGETEDREELAEAQFLDLLPRTPEEAAREAARQLARQALRAGRGGAGASAAAAVGDMPVADVLASQGTRRGSEALRGDEPVADAGQRARPEVGDGRLPGGDAMGSAGNVAAGASGAGGTLAGAAGAVGAVGAVGAAVGSAAGSAVGSAAGAAATVAGSAVTTAVLGSVAAGTATSVAGATGSVVANVAALGSRLLSSGAAEGEAARSAAQLTSGSAAGSDVAASTAPTGAAAPAVTAPAAVTAAASPAATATATANAGAGAVPAVPVSAAPAAAQAAVPAAGDLPVEMFASRSATAPLAAARVAPVAAAAVSQALPAGEAAPQLPGAGPAANSAGPASGPASTAGPGNASSTAPAERAGPPAPAAPPVHLPRVNPHGYTEGDTFTYQVRDTWRDEVTSTYVQSVESVTPDGSMVGNGAQVEMDPEGRLRSVRNPDGSMSVFEPAQELWWSRPERGQSRRVKFREHFERGDSSGQIDWEGMSNVGRARTVRTPAGAFEALPIQTTGWFTERPASGAAREGRWTRTVWYATQLGHPVAIDIEDVDRAGKLLRRERVELLNAQTSRAQP